MGAREAQEEKEEPTKQAILYNASPYPWALATNRLQVRSVLMVVERQID